MYPPVEFTDGSRLSEFPCVPGTSFPAVPEMLTSCVEGTHVVVAKQVSSINTSGLPSVHIQNEIARRGGVRNVAAVRIDRRT